MSKLQNGISNDPQLQAVNKFTEAQPLLDVMLKRFESLGRDKADPFVIRIVIAGKRGEKSTRPLGVLMPEFIDNAVSSSENPLSNKGDACLKPSVVLIDYEDYFIELIEGYERHIIMYLNLLKKHCDQKEGASCSDIRVLFLIDDVQSPLTSCFSFFDKIPSMTTEGENEQKSEEEIADMIVEDVQNLMKLGSLSANEAEKKRRMFLDSARVTHPFLFPRLTSIKMYLEQDLCLTLSEYISLFGKVPELTRDEELNHPAEDPLKY